MHARSPQQKITYRLFLCIQRGNAGTEPQAGYPGAAAARLLFEPLNNVGDIAHPGVQQSRRLHAGV